MENPLLWNIARTNHWFPEYDCAAGVVNDRLKSPRVRRSMTDFHSSFACALIEIAHDAGRLLLRYLQSNPVPRRKADGTPVTAADEAAEKLIVERLMALTPGIAVIAEEHVASHGVSSPGDRFYLVDPLDGTDEFIQGRGEFTVNIALIEGG